MAMRPVVGQVVRSLSGRDSGRAFVVVSVVDEKFVEVVDGDLRPVENPKRKNLRHLELTDTVLESIKSKVAAGERLTNEEVVHEISTVPQ